MKDSFLHFDHVTLACLLFQRHQKSPGWILFTRLHDLYAMTFGHRRREVDYFLAYALVAKEIEVPRYLVKSGR